MIIFRNFQFLDDSVGLIKSFVLKRFQEKMFFLCRLIERKSFFYANHAIWQKSWSTEYSAHCFPLNFGTECLQRRKKSLSVFVLDSKTKEDDKIVLQSWASKLAESDTAAHGPYFSAILLSLKSMERSLTNRNFLFSKQMIFLLKRCLLTGMERNWSLAVDKPKYQPLTFSSPREDISKFNTKNCLHIKKLSIISTCSRLCMDFSFIFNYAAMSCEELYHRNM